MFSNLQLGPEIPDNTGDDCCECGDSQPGFGHHPPLSHLQEKESPDQPGDVVTG